MKSLLAVLLLTVAVVSVAAEGPRPEQFSKHTQFLQTAPPAPAARPWYSPGNLSVAAGANYRWMTGGDAALLTPRKEWVFGLYNAWQLTQHVDFIGNVAYGVDTKAAEYTLGVRLILKLPD